MATVERRLLAVGLLLVLAAPLAAAPAQAADTTPPYIEETSVPVGTEVLFGGPEASVGVRACDDESPMPTASTAATHPNGTMVENARYILSNVSDSPCRDIEFIMFQLPIGTTSYNVTIEDAAGNAVTVGPFLLKRVLPTVNFSGFDGAGPFPVLEYAVSINATAAPGLAVDLSSVEWSVIGRFAGAPPWHSAGLAGAAPNATLTADLALPGSGTYYVQWSAMLEGGGARFYSRLYASRADAVGPSITSFDCGPLHPASDVVSLTVSAVDDMTGVNLNDTRILVTGPNAQETNTTPDSFDYGTTKNGTAAFTVHLFPGTNHLEAFAFDNVGNRNAPATCTLERPDPANEPVGATTPTEGNMLPLLLVTVAAIGGALLYSVVRASRERE